MSGNRPHRSVETIQPATKMRIKAFPQVMDERYVKQIWNQLKRALQEIQKKNNSGLSFEELYRNSYTLVLQKHGDLLYNGTKDVVLDHMIKLRDELVSCLNGSFLNVLNTYWKDHQIAMVMIRDILMYMDRVFVDQKKLPSVYNMGLESFRDAVIFHPPIRHHLKQILLETVQQERRGEVVSMSLVKDATQMLVHLGVDSTNVYESEFENHFLILTQEFYQQESEKFLSENTSASLYIKKVKQRIEEEERRADLYLNSSTKPKLVDVLEHVLITNHAQTIVDMENSGLIYMLSNERYEDIKEMYSLLSRTDSGLKIMSACISQYLRNRGRAIVEDYANKTPQAYIQELLELREKSDRLLTQALNNERLFRNQILADFEFFINLSQQSAEYLSLFIDDKLKRGTRGLPDQDIEAVLDKCIILFRLLQEKDTFERYYKNHLMKRLLSERSQSDDQEKSMISKLKTECGYDFTSKLEGMFKDITVSNLLMLDFNSYLSTTHSLPQELSSFDINVRVLTTGYWPGFTNLSTIALPPLVEQKYALFTKFYLSKHNGRRLSLQPQLGTADMPALFYPQQANSDGNSASAATSTNATAAVAASAPAGGSTGGVLSPDTANSVNIAIGGDAGKPRRYILNVTTYQMIILFKFNEKPRYKYEELLAQTGIPSAELTRALQSLACAKPTQRILNKEPKNAKEVAPTDVFSVNENFTSKHIKIKVISLSSRETEPERIETKQKVDMNRNYVVEAAITRIMKARKEMEHNLLVAEVTNQLRSRFQPSIQLIKSRIENLLEREYLERKDDRRVYVYKA